MLWLAFGFMALVCASTWAGSVVGARVNHARVRRMLRNMAPNSARRSDPPPIPREVYTVLLASREKAKDARDTAQRVVALTAQH